MRLELDVTFCYSAAQDKERHCDKGLNEDEL